MQRKTRFLSKVLALMLSVIMIASTIPVVAAAGEIAAESTTQAEAFSTPPDGFVNIYLKGPYRLDPEIDPYDPELGLVPPDTPPPTVMYRPVITPDNNDIIVYRFSFTPTLHNAASTEYTRIHILPAGYTGQAGWRNRYFLPMLRRHAPTDFRIIPATRAFVILGDDHAGSASTADNIMAAPWEAGNTYDFVFTMDVSDAENDNITFTLEVFLNGNPHNAADESLWRDVPLRSYGQRTTAQPAGQYPVQLLNRTRFANGIGGVVIGRFEDQNYNEAIFTVPAPDHAYIESGPDYPTVNIDTTLAVNSLAGSVVYTPPLVPLVGDIITYNYRFTVNPFTQLGGEAELFFVPPDFPAGQVNRNALRLNAEIRLALRNLPGGIEFLIGTRAPNNGLGGFSSTQGLILPGETYQVTVEMNTVTGQYRVMLREFGVANPAVILPFTPWQHRTQIGGTNPNFDPTDGRLSDFSNGIGAVHVVSNSDFFTARFNLPAVNFLQEPEYIRPATHQRLLLEMHSAYAPEVYPLLRVEYNFPLMPVSGEIEYTIFLYAEDWGENSAVEIFLFPYGFDDSSFIDNPGNYTQHPTYVPYRGAFYRQVAPISLLLVGAGNVNHGGGIFAMHTPGFGPAAWERVGTWTEGTVYTLRFTIHAGGGFDLTVETYGGAPRGSETGLPFQTTATQYDFSAGLGAIVVKNAWSYGIDGFVDVPQATGPRDPRTFQIGPGMEFTDVQTFGWGSLIPGDVVEIYPNVGGVPWRTMDQAHEFNWVVNVTSSGTVENPIIVRGMPNQYGERPILQGQPWAHAVVRVAGDHIVLENLVVDGGLLDFIDWLNGETLPGNRFGVNTTERAFATTLTLDNFHEYFNREVTNPFFHHGQTVNWVIPRPGGIYTPNSIMYDDTFHAPRRLRPDGTVRNRARFASRGIFHENGYGLTIYNILAIGSGSGMTSSNQGAGSLLICSSEFGFNGMHLAGHNIYLNSDNALFPEMTITIRNNFIHNASGTMGFRTRVGRIHLYNNVFLDNNNGHVDFTTIPVGNAQNLYNAHGQPPSMADRFSYRPDCEIIGNLFVLTAPFNQDHISLGGAGLPNEITHARYRFVNNTFVHLGPGWADSPNLFLRARFGIESVEMYNNIFYSDTLHAVMPLGDHLSPERIQYLLARGGTNDDGTPFNPDAWDLYGNPYDWIYDIANNWTLGVRQVAGANNWVSHGVLNTQMPMPTNTARFLYGGVPSEWTNTTWGEPGEVPFVDIAALDFRVRADSTAAVLGVPVGTTTDFMTLAEYNERLAAGELPTHQNWEMTQTGTTFTATITYTVAPWRDINFPNPATANLTTPPFNFQPSGLLGNIWQTVARTDSAAPVIGAFLTDAPMAHRVEFNLAGGTRTDGGELVQTVATGENAVAPTVAKDGFFFVRWDTPFTNVTTDLTVTAIWQQIRTAPRVFEVGPDHEFATLEELRQYVIRLGNRGGNFANLLPGDTILVFPNIVNGRNVPHPIPRNGRLFLNASGTADAPITLRGVIDEQGRRPIIASAWQPNDAGNYVLGIHSVLTVGGSPWGHYMHSGDHITVENLIVDGGMFEMFDFFNGVAGPGNRFYNRFGAPGGNGRAFSVDVTLENFPTLIHTPFENSWFADSSIFGNRTYGGQAHLHNAFINAPYVFMIRTAGAPHNMFSNRAILIEGGDHVTIYNTLVIGGGTGIASADGGPGTIVIDRVEAAYNGMHFSGHNLYFNGDMMRHPHLTLTLRNSFIHNAIGTQGFRTRVGRNIVYNNIFLNNAAKQVDLVGFDAGGPPMGIMIPVYRYAQQFLGLAPDQNIPHWESSFSLPQDTEFIGNVSIYTGPFHQNHVHIGGAGQVWEESWGRYRFLNNTFIHLAQPPAGATAREAIGARFGIESVELFNNVFYSNSDTFYAFIDEMTDWSQITWAFGERQIQGSNNWMHYNVRLNATRNIPGSGLLTDYIDNTIFGEPGEMPFVSLGGHELATGLVIPSAFDLRLREDSTAFRVGVPVSTVAEFMTQEEHAYRLANNLLPEIYDWRFENGVVISVPGGGWPTPYLPYSDTTSFAPWRGLGFGDEFHDGHWTWQPPVSENVAEPPSNFVSTRYGFTWAHVSRPDSNAPLLGAFYTTVPVFDFNIFNNGPGGTQYPRPNAGLAEAGIIRMWTLLNGVGAPVYLAAADTIVALDQNGQCAMEFVRVGRVWVDGQGWANRFNLLDINKNGDWQFINLSITVFGQTVDVLLVNALFEVTPPPVFTWNIFNNGPGGTQYPRPNAGLAAAGLIRMWTQLDGVNAPVYLAAADTIVALDQDENCAMEFVRVGRVWVAGEGWQDYFNLLDINKNGNWQQIDLYITVFGQTVHALLVNTNYVPAEEYHTVTFVIEAGAVGVYAETTITVEVPDGETIPADAIPSVVARPGFYFIEWYPSDPADVVVTEDMTFTARFNLLWHYVTFEAGDGGELVAADGFGLVVRIRDGFTFWADRVPTPVADYGYEFVMWYPVDPADVVVRENMTFTAVFAEAAPVVPQIISVTPNPAVAEQGGTVEITVITQGMPDGAWVDLNVAWRPGLSVVGGPRFYITDNKAVITIAAATDARLGRDGFSVTARAAGDWGIPFIIDSYTFVVEVK